MSVTREVVSYVLDSATVDALPGEALRLLKATGTRLDLDVAEAIVRVLEPRVAGQSDLLEELAQETGPTSRHVLAQLQAATGRLDEAIDTITAVQAAIPTPQARVQALRARWLLRRERIVDAARDLQLALYTYPEYGFFVRTERLIQKILASPAWQAKRRCRVAVLASSTTALFAPVLRAALFRDGIAADVYEGAFGNYRQEILDTSSRLYAFAPQIVIILLNHRDLALPPRGGQPQANEFCQGLRQLWSFLQARSPCHIIQVGFDSPPLGAWGALEDMLPDGRRQIIARTNQDLSTRLPPGVSYLDVDSLSGLSPAVRSDEQWHASRQYPPTDALPLFADATAAQIRAVLGLTAKVLALDLDNTLWGGVIGEDGIGGIRIGPPSAEGEAYATLQHYLSELKARGVLLVACSKNNAADAEAPFEKHDAMVLKREDFVAFQANWNDKATSLRAIAEELSLGLDSFVFLDDNPLERAWVRQQLPQVAVLEPGTSASSLLWTLRRAMMFEPIAVTSEDLQRSRSYQSNAAVRRAHGSGGASLETFLADLGMKCVHGPVDADTLDRVAQLINKTNQFNLTTRRYTVEQVKRMAESPEWWCRWFRLSDRYGDHGLVGVMLAQVGSPAWSIDTWLMSCRILGRRMEEFMVARVLDAAAGAGATLVTGRYLPTAKNELVRDLYPRVGFAPTEIENTFTFTLDGRPFPSSPWIATE